MDTDRFAIPGFMTPETPNEDSRQEFMQGEPIVVTVDPAYVGAKLPAYAIFLTQEFGSEIDILLDVKERATFREINPDGTWKITVSLDSLDIQMAPGVYTLRVTLSGKTVFKKFLSVLPGPGPL